MLDQLIEYMGYGYGPHHKLPCPANQNPYQRLRQGRYGRGGALGSDIRYGVKNYVNK